MRTRIPQSAASLLGLALTLLAIAAVVSPWGNYPVNDDWQYARIAKRLAETGRFVVDVDVAPSLVGQIWLSVPLVKLLGFSHTLLRVETMTVAIMLLWIVDRILRCAGSPSGVRIVAAALLVANPIFLHLAFSYMTEPYGYMLAFAGALVWLNDRTRRDGPGAPLIGWRAALAAATLVGGSFWIRQFCAAVFPALAGASVLRTVIGGDRASLRRSMPVLACATAWFVVLVMAYFAWAKLSGNYRPAFGGQIRSLVHFDGDLLVISAFELATYLTAFLFPFFLLEDWQTTRWSRFVAAAALLAIFVFAARSKQPLHAAFHHHVRFPFAANVLYDTGVGPITLTSTYFDPSAPRPRWPPAAWPAIQWLLAGGLLAWARLAAGRSDEPRCPGMAAEIRDFGVLLAAGSFLLYTQAFQWQVLDRYYLPSVFGGVIALGARATRLPVRSRPWLAIAAVVPMAWFAVAAVHDYFRWNDARWTAVALASSRGGRPELLDGGYEINGWLNYDAAMANVHPAGCHGECRCPQLAFFCTDDSYLISMGLPRGRTMIAELPVPWWLADGPNIVVSRR